MIDIDALNAYHLADLADCHSPDSLESPGATFLLNIASSVREAIEEGEGVMDEDAAHEIADGAVPIYTYQKWKTFTDLCAWQEDVTDFGPIEDLDQASNVALYMIAERLVNALAEEGPE